MKGCLAMITLAMTMTACYGTGNSMPPAGDDLATAPLGGEYVGEATLERDSCDGLDPNRDSDKDYFTPIPVLMRFFPQNEDQSIQTFVVSTVVMKDVKPVRHVVGVETQYQLNHEMTTADGITVYFTTLQGSIASGELSLTMAEGAYEGTTEVRGDLLCDLAYKLHAQKVKNYPYVAP